MDAAGCISVVDMIRVVVADDQAVVRSGLRMILESQEGIEVVGEAADGQAALQLVASLDPDVVLMDIRMPLLDGIEATGRLTDASARARVLVLTTYGLDEHVYSALRAGAAGFLLKTDSPQQLVEAVQVVARGDALLAPEITRRLIARFVSSGRPDAPAAALAQLTTREREILTQVARGRSNAEIAAALYISTGTVKTHVARVLSKLELRDRVQAVVFAYECGIVQPGQAANSGSEAS
jgi:DNA-binding NarL/FixJ family response regulator